MSFFADTSCPLLGHSPRKKRVFLRTPSLVLPIYSKRIKINRDLLY
jgi:hypothetical protein